MKLNEKILKEMILNEIKRRDFLKRSAAGAALASVGGLLDSTDTSKKSEFFDSIIGREESPGSKQALLSFQFVPDLPYYVQAPAMERANLPYYYVMYSDMLKLIDRDPSFYADPEYALSRYEFWSPKDLYDHIFGKLPTWANEVDEDPMSMKMTKTVPVKFKEKEGKIRDEIAKLLPLSWTIALHAFIGKMEKIYSMMDEAGDKTDKYRTLLYWNTSRKDWQFLEKAYEQLLIMMESRPFVINPNYGKPA